jgi:hypothetical protein
MTQLGLIFILLDLLVVFATRCKHKKKASKKCNIPTPVVMAASPVVTTAGSDAVTMAPRLKAQCQGGAHTTTGPTPVLNPRRPPSPSSALCMVGAV